jgi:hypothetical protein
VPNRSGYGMTLDMKVFSPHFASSDSFDSASNARGNASGLTPPTTRTVIDKEQRGSGSCAQSDTVSTARKQVIRVTERQSCCIILQ